MSGLMMHLQSVRAVILAGLLFPSLAFAGAYCDYTDTSFCQYYSFSDTCYDSTQVSACPTANLIGVCTRSGTSFYNTYWYARNGMSSDGTFFAQSCASEGYTWSSGGSTPAPTGPTASTVLPAAPVSQSSYTAPSGQLPEAAVQVQASGTYGNASLRATVNVAAALGTSNNTQNSGFAYSCNTPSYYACQDYYVGTYSPTVCGTASIIEARTTPCATANRIATCTSTDFFTTYFYSGYPEDAIQSACSAQPYGVLSRRASATRSGGAYNIYVVAMLPGALSGSSSAVLYVKPQAPASWRQLDWPMAAFMSNVAQSAVNDEVVVDILENTNLLGLIGAEIYVGYGTSDQEMLAANRYRGVYKVQ